MITSDVDFSTGRILGIDGGKTKTVVESYTGGKSVGRNQGPGLEIITNPQGQRLIREALSIAVSPFLGTGKFDCVCIGLNGVHAPSEAAETMVRIIREIVPTQRVVVTSDVVTTYCGALGLQPGAVVAAGTGAIAMGMNSAGNVQRADGWGYLLGDDGSGYAIGQRALSAVLRDIDGRGAPTLLTRFAKKRFGTPADIAGAVYGAEMPAQVIASFAKDASEAAHDGDPQAAAIWVWAGRELARSVVAAALSVVEAGETFKVSWSGGLFNAGQLLYEPFEREVTALTPYAVFHQAHSDAVGGAFVLGAQAEPRITSATLWDGFP